MAIDKLATHLSEWYMSPALQERRTKRQLRDKLPEGGGKQRWAELSSLLRRLLDMPPHMAHSVHHSELGPAEDLHEVRRRICLGVEPAQAGQSMAFGEGTVISGVADM